MPAPVTASDSYATAMNAPLSVSAPGVLSNDTGTDLSAALVADSAEHGTVILNSDGSFTFTPDTNFVGDASFRYKVINGDLEESAETTVYVVVGDCVEWAHLTSSAEGQRTVEGDGRGSTTWRVRADRRNRTQHEILSSPTLPQRGQPLYRYKLGGSGAYTITRSHAPDGDPVSDTTVVVLTEARQDPGNPWLWTVIIRYDGVNDPTAELPDAQSHETEYQDYVTEDIHGMPVTNSAIDPVEGGMPVDAAWDSVVVTRNLPFDAWNMLKKQGYRNTLNLLPYTLGNQVDDDGDPVVMPPGTVRLKRITEQRMVRAKAALVGDARFYWRVTFELLLDDRVFRPSGGAAEQKVRHRYVYADAGFNTLSNSVRVPVLLAGASRPTEPQLLDGAGGLLANPQNSPPPSTVPSDSPDVCAATNKVFVCPSGGTLTKAAGTLLDGCYSTTGDANDLTAHLVTNVTAAMGTLTGGAVGTDGSFEFVKNTSPPFVGYAWFTYRVKAGGVDATYSDPATVLIFVGTAPVMNARERYRMKDWSPLAVLLEGW